MINQKVDSQNTGGGLPTAQDRLAKHIVARLRESSARADALPPQVQARLNQTIEAALAAHVHAVQANQNAHAVQVQQKQPVSAAAFLDGFGQRLVKAYDVFSAFLGRPWLSLSLSAATVLLAVVGVVQFGAAFYNDSVTATADLDAAILADDLPPDAYLDPGFVRYLREFKPKNDLPQNDGLDDWFKNIPAEGQTSI